MIKLFALVFLGLSASTLASTENLQIVQECLDSLSSDKVIRRKPLIQKESDIIFFDYESQYWEVRVHLHFRLESFVGPSTNRKNEVAPIVRKTLDKVEEYYKSQGLNITIKATFDTEMSYMPLPVPNNAYLIYLRPNRGIYMNAMRWGVNFDWDVNLRSKIYAHELTHLFEILDEYEGASLLSEIGEENSLMRNWDHEKGRLFPRHIKQILSPLCP